MNAGKRIRFVLFWAVYWLLTPVVFAPIEGFYGNAANDPQVKEKLMEIEGLQKKMQGLHDAITMMGDSKIYYLESRRDWRGVVPVFRKQIEFYQSEVSRLWDEIRIIESKAHLQARKERAKN